MKTINNEKGYILIESLVGLVLLSILSLTLILTIPKLIELQYYINQKQLTYQLLHDAHIFNTHEFQHNHKNLELYFENPRWCARFKRRNNEIVTTCL